MPRKKTRLATVSEPAVDASIIHLENAPFLNGKDRENLLCGSCGIVICKGVSVESCLNKFSVPVQLLVKCPKCRTHNELPATVGG